MKEIYQQTKEELFKEYGDPGGLTTRRAQELLEKYGENLLREEKKKSIFSIFLRQFADLLVVILVAAAVVSMFSGNVESTIVIFAVLIMNAVLGTIQYVKAEKSLAALKNLSAPHARVIRDGMKQEIPASEVVPGDILLLEAGDMVAADGRIISNHSLQVNESSLTGESTNVDKLEGVISEDVPLGDRVNMVFSGSLVTYGRAEVLVTATGMTTEMGRIASLMNDTEDRETPLQVSLDNFSKKLAILIMVISGVVFALRIWQGETILSSLMFAVALAVAAIPEALGSIVTIVQAMGTRKMAEDNAIIKELKAVESLGCVSVICSDKTGTLTQNRMTVKDVYIAGQCIKPEEINEGTRAHRYLLYNAILNNDSGICSGEDVGDPTETCLLHMARKTDISCGNPGENPEEDIRKMIPRLEELPFDSDRKLMSSKYVIEGTPTVFTKGAVDVLLGRVENIMDGQEVRPMTDADREAIKKQNRAFSENGMRVLAFAYKECNEDEKLCMDSEYGYTFTGLVAMIDPPRDEAVEAVATAIGAGIKPVMITGDHKVTATAIAKQIGIYRDGDVAVTGQELGNMSDDELDSKLAHISVYARVSPSDKIRIVDAWQRKGKVVAMTGDGVNDAPALKKADIGVAMGITGTEVSKDASAMILSDDNFATIIKAVLNGRNVYRNIMNAILFLLSGNLAAIFVVLFCSVMALPTPFEPVHLLFINLLTDSLPALAIGMEPSDRNLLKNKPRDPKKGILNGRFCGRLALYGILIAIATQTAFYVGRGEAASTMAFATLTLARLFHGFTCRGEKSIFKLGLRSNKWSNRAFAAGVVLLAAVILIPAMRGLFMVTGLTGTQLMWIVGLAFAPTLVIQMIRVIREAR